MITVGNKIPGKQQATELSSGGDVNMKFQYLKTKLHITNESQGYVRCRSLGDKSKSVITTDLHTVICGLIQKNCKQLKCKDLMCHLLID
jgi:hypothetical protein